MGRLIDGLCAAELASRSSQQDVMSRELEHLRRQCVEYQQEADRSATLLAKAAGECDVARAAAQRLTGQLEDCERRKREAEIELARLRCALFCYLPCSALKGIARRGSRDVDVQERRRVELEANRDQSKVAEIMKEMETLQASHMPEDTLIASCKQA